MGNWLTNNPVTQFSKQLNVPGTLSDLWSNIQAGGADVRSAGRGAAALDPSANKPPDQKAAPSSQPTDAPAVTAGTPQAAGPVTNTPTYQPLINPLAWNAVFAQHIAPLMSQIASQNAAANQQAMGMAQADLAKYPMPAQFKSAFGQILPQMQQDANNVNAALMQAAMTAPAFDQSMTNMGNIQSKLAQIYAEQQYNRAAGIANPTGAQGGPQPLTPQQAAAAL